MHSTSGNLSSQEEAFQAKRNVWSFYLHKNTVLFAECFPLEKLCKHLEGVGK